ncbi:hypothetical protein G6F56_007250 [Rhizopus delemar]|nr:hypothetical protein G6F56_007250 [Rhizopus delemar]
MGHLKLELTLEEISNHDSLKQQDIKCLPAMNYVSRAARRGTQKAEEDVDNNLCILWEKLSNSLQKMMTAFQSGINRERLMAVSRVCNDTGFAIFLKNQIEVKTRNLVNNNAWSSAYYLEMAKGLHARRLTQTCLAEKIQKMHGYLPPSQNTWPSDEPEKPRLNTHSTQGWLQFHLMTLAQHYNKDHLLDDAQFQKEYVDIIPNNWTVCSLTMDPEHNNLYAIQLRAGEAPFVIKLSLDRIIKKLDAGKSFQQVDAELKNIVEESDDTIQYSAQCITPNEIKQWWSKRSSLDLRLKTLLSDVQEWFGGFKGILSGQRNESLDDLKKFCDQLNELVHKIVIKVSIKKAKVEFSLHFCRIILELGQSPSPKELEDVVNFVLSCYEEHSIYIGFDQVGNEITHGLTSLISSYHNNSGRKGINTKKSMPNDHVILILDKYMQTLPMENIPILRKQAVSRLPCLSFLRDRILYAQSKKFTEGKNLSREQNHGNDLHISKKNTFYVLNPSGDLVHTQKEFENLFKSYEDWNGISGTAPIELQCKDALQSKDLYMYFGHSAGQSFLRGTTVRNLSKCAVSLLMGCSSGKMESNGEYDPHGYILNYLVAGSPAVVGNLWDVTDRSIDELTKHMLEKWGVLDKSKGKSLVQAVMESRDKSNLKYLIGAAPVVYGVPVYL